MMSNLKRIIPVFIIISVFLSSCVTNTMVTFESNVEGSELFLDGESQGELPARLSMSNAIWNDPVVRVEAIGYKAIERTLIREIKIINGLTGLLWWPNLLWSFGPYPYQFFKLSPIVPENESI